MPVSNFRIKEFGEPNNKLVFFFTGMGTRTWMYTRPIKRMVENGFQVIAYDFDPLVVHKGDADIYLKIGTDVVDSVSQKVTQLKSEGISNFSAFGFSMGTLLAIKCAAEISDIQKVIIMLTYGSVAENIWTWWFIKPAKKRAINQGYDLPKLDEKLAPISPIPNASKLKGKKVLLYLSHKDKIILYKQSSQFKDALDKVGVDYKLIENKRFGHNLSAYNNFRKHNEWLEFLNL